MTDKKRNITFSKGAHSAFGTLNENEQKKAIHYLKLISNNKQNTIQSKIYKLTVNESTLYAIKLNLKLRIVVEVKEEEVSVIDILNHDLFVKYFNNRKP